MDMGGHRFFSKVPEVNAWWQNLLPLQGSPSKDDLILGRSVSLAENGANPEKDDEVMLCRHRVSRILFDSKFYDYPVSLKFATLKNMGFFNTMKVGFSYLHSVFHKLPETNLENFYINRFGRKLYEIFFEYYTENLWGRHPSEIDASWGAQRVKGLSISAVLKDIFGKIFKGKNRKVETSLIEEFKYPKLGPGQLWDITAEKVRELGGTIITNAKVVRFHKNHNRQIESLVYEKDGKQIEEKGDIFISPCL
jgi:protoporphyrinogen oxidase